MPLQENVKKKAEGFGKLAPAFLEGAEFALIIQWWNNSNVTYWLSIPDFDKNLL